MPAKQGNRRNLRQAQACKGDSGGKQRNRTRSGQGRGKGTFCNGTPSDGQQQDKGKDDR